MGRGVGLGVGLGVNTCTHGVLAKQVSPASHPDGAPDGQGRAHELTASTHDEPQKFPDCCAFDDDDNDAAVINIRDVMEVRAVLAAVYDEVMVLLLLVLLLVLLVLLLLLLLLLLWNFILGFLE